MFHLTTYIIDWVSFVKFLGILQKYVENNQIGADHENLKLCSSPLVI